IGAAHAGWAQDVPGRAAARQQAETRLAGLEERLGQLAPAGAAEEPQRRMVSRRVALARKLLARNNPRAASAVAEQADVLLKAFEAMGGGQCRALWLASAPRSPWRCPSWRGPPKRRPSA